jgi:hypothetical protein
MQKKIDFYDKENKRKELRYPIDILFDDFNLTTTLKKGNLSFLIELVDISYSGAKIKSDKNLDNYLKVDEEIDLKIDQIEVNGRIAWMNCQVAGIEFSKKENLFLKWVRLNDLIFKKTRGVI